MNKIYNPKQIEETIYKFWETYGFFEPNNNYTQPYCIMMPPPNITGKLHLGHAFQQTIMDILVRYKRMQGKNTLWATGFDHAGIATQILIEKKIYYKTGKSRKDYTKDFLLKEIWKWTEQSEQFITYQMKRLGNSVSWKNKRFTMDPKMSFAVKEAFIRLYKDNLIYKGKKLINWDPKLQTAISDLEVSNKKIKGSIYYIRYKLDQISDIDQNHNYLVIATTRPETILGDVAIAVHPEDPRYHNVIGKYVLTPITNRRIPIIADKHIDIQKGTGCMKVTPGHDFNDYEIGQRHELNIINIFSVHNKILKTPEIFNSQGKSDNQLQYQIPQIFHNLDYNKARKQIILECNKLHLLDDIQDYNTTILYNRRTDTIINPMLTDQWYIRTKLLAKQAIYVVEKNIIEFIPKKYKNNYLKWMYNLQDWCISRQISWGHEIPAWYDDNNNLIYVGHCEKDIRIENQLNNNIILRKDNNVLDTWFSSSLWTFSNLGWPQSNFLLKHFHPTNIIVSGFDIIFFWIARMIMLTMHLIKDEHGNSQIPFKQIYITGLIRDKFGHKMSKSKGNIIDPLDIIDGIPANNLQSKKINTTPFLKSINNITKHTKEQFQNGIKAYGADSLRLTLTALSCSGKDIHWDINRLSGYHNFCNKLWNVSKFVLTHTNHQNRDIYNNDNQKIFSLADRWIMTKLQQTIHSFYNSLELYRFDKIVSILYEFTWHQFCDWYIELTKPIIYNENHNELQLQGTKYTLITSLEILLRLAHPIIPFITEKIWQKVKLVLGINNVSIMLQPFPKYNSSIIDLNAITDLEYIKNIISEIRNIRLNTGISYNIPLKIAFNNVSEKIKKLILDNYHILIKIAQLKNINFVEKYTDHNKSILILIKNLELIIFIPEFFDKNTAINRLHKKIDSVQKQIDVLQNTLNNTHHTLNTESIFLKKQEKLTYFNELKEKLLNQYSIIKNY